ncbi:MAG TPA: tRNA lysidine(34) synthetase TilS [Sphingomicrobium sp.]|nr:tRNA lysidine(34) synthetase TilS [Sphingomicrobium sp.]
MVPEPAFVERFEADLDPLIAPGARLGIAVSGGPDSLALLLLAAAARPGDIEAASVDHGLRSGARDEASMVGEICAKLNVPHAILTARWNELPSTAIQERARRERYRLLGYWTEERRLEALVTAHHADDQAETVLMRFNRGSGVRGLAGMRVRSITPGNHVRLLRPLLGWRRTDLERICADAGVTPVADPSNADERFERVRIRRSLAHADWLDPSALARSAAYLAEADAALEWAARLEWARAVHERRGEIVYRPDEAPAEILRRVISRILRKLASEGETEFRGAELDRLLESLVSGNVSTLRGVQCTGGREWRFRPASPRRA